MEAVFVKLWFNRNLESVLMLIRFTHERRRQKREKIGGYRISMKMNEAVIHVGLTNIRSGEKERGEEIQMQDTEREVGVEGTWGERDIKTLEIEIKDDEIWKRR